MDNELQKIIELSRDPMLAAEEGKILCMNTAARSLFPKADVGSRAPDLIPEHFFFEETESFFSSASINGKSYTVSALRCKGALLLSLAEEKNAAELRGCLSDSLMNEMLSSLFNVGLSVERISSHLDLNDPEVLKYYSALNHNYYKLNHRLSNLSAFCSFSEGNMLVVPRYTDLAALGRDLAASVNLMVGNTAAHVEYSCTPDSLSACVDAPKVERLILNLLANALKYTPKDGLVRLRFSKSSDNAVISVDDNGCGIAPEKLKTVFSGYENRLDERNLTDPGTGGLGLGICRRIAEKHGGTLILESRKNEGTSVRVLLPLTQPHCTELRSAVPPYENSGISVLLTELCDILDVRSYEPKYLD